jgi:hypothetical protein
MTVTLSPEVERVLKDRAARLGKSPDQLAEEVLRQALLAHPDGGELPPRDEWEARLLNIGKPAGTVLTNEQLRRENLYED